MAHWLGAARLARSVLDPLRARVPFRISSWYRSPSHNAGVRGAAPTSRHQVGEAADIAPVAPWTSEELAAAVLLLRLPFDQLIWYDPSRGGHVHIGQWSGRTPRRDVLRGVAGTEDEPPQLPSATAVSRARARLT